MTNVQEYRLRVFEAGFIDPNLSYLEDHQISTLLKYPWRPGNHRFLGHDASSGLLRVCLLREATWWITVGEYLGYFPEGAAPFRIQIYGRPIEDYAERLELFTDPFIFRPENPGFRDGDRFADTLPAELEDLTPERLEYVRLIVFAADHEWQYRLAGFAELKRLLESRPDSVLDDKVMDDVVWAFHGPMEQESPDWDMLRRRPSYWRLEERWLKSDSWPARRLDELRQAREELQAVVGAVFSVDERASIELLHVNALNRLSTALERQAGRAPGNQDGIPEPETR